MKSDRKRPCKGKKQESSQTQDKKAKSNKATKRKNETKPINEKGTADITRNVKMECKYTIMLEYNCPRVPNALLSLLEEDFVENLLKPELGLTEHDIAQFILPHAVPKTRRYKC